MGDRGNIVIEDSNKNPLLFMYTHWNGSDLPTIVAKGLTKGTTRWDDDSYTNRILFTTLIHGDLGITGFGLDVIKHDGGTEVYICHEKRTVRYNDESYSFQHFIDKFLN